MPQPAATAVALVESARPVLDALAEAILILDLQGRILFANKGARSLYQWGDAAVEGHLARELLVASENISRARRISGEVAAGARWTGEFPLQLASGTEIVVRASNTPLLDTAGSVVGMIGVVRDVTKEHAAVNASVDRERQLTEAEVLARLGSWAWEPATNRVVWSPGLYRIYGLPPDQPATFEAFVERVHPDDRHIIETVAEVGEGLDEYHLAFRIVRPNGEVRWTENRGRIMATDAKGNASRVVGVTIDLTDQHDARERVEAFHSIASATRDAMFTTKLDGTITTWNPGAEDLYGFEAGEAVGRSLLDVIVPPDRASETAAMLAEVARGERVVFPMTLRRHRDDHMVPVALVASPLRGRDGRVAGAALVDRDVSNELLLLQQAAHATKLDAVDQLAAGIAHDFANILTAVQGFLSVARDKVACGEDPQAELDRSLDAVARGARLVDRLMSFTRPDASRQSTFAVRDVIADILPVLQQLAGPDVCVDTPDDGSAVLLSGDATVLEQMLVNLVVNARDAMAQGGEIEVSCAVEVITERLATTIVPLSPGRYAAIRVRDTGVGMDEGVLRRCAEPLFTTKPSGVGTGLGLASVVGAARSFGGSVAVDSAPGKGTTVTVYWPVADPGRR